MGLVVSPCVVKERSVTTSMARLRVWQASRYDASVCSRDVFTTSSASSRRRYSSNARRSAPSRRCCSSSRKRCCSEARLSASARACRNLAISLSAISITAKVGLVDLGRRWLVRFVLGFGGVRGAGFPGKVLADYVSQRTPQEPSHTAFDQCVSRRVAHVPSAKSS